MAAASQRRAFLLVSPGPRPRTGWPATGGPAASELAWSCPASGPG